MTSMVLISGFQHMYLVRILSFIVLIFMRDVKFLVEVIWRLGPKNSYLEPGQRGVSSQEEFCDAEVMG